MSSTQQRILMKFRSELFDKILVLPVSYYDEHKTGRIMSRITNDINFLEQSLYLMVEIAQNLVFTIIFATALFFQSWILTLLVLVIFSLTGVISRKFGDRIRKHNKNLVENISDISGFLQEKISSIRIVKSYTREDYERKSFKKKNDENYFHNFKIIRTMALLSPTNEFLNTFIASVLVILTGFLFLEGSMTMESMINFLILINLMAKPVKALGEGVARLQKNLVSAKLIFEMLDLKEEDLNESGKKTKFENGDVEFKNVNFSYNSDNEVLKNINFRVKSG